MSMPTPFTLPTVDLIGGSFRSLTFNTFADSKSSPYDIRGCIAYFSVSPYINPESGPIIPRRRMDAGTVSSSEGEIKAAYLTVRLSASDTMNLQGKYIYQIAIVNPSGDQDISQGILFVFRNVDPNKEE